MEPFVRMSAKCSKEDVDIPDSGLMNVEKKFRRKHFDGDDSTMEEAISQSEAYHIGSGEQVEASVETAPKAVPRSLKRKRIDTPVFDAK